MIIREHYLSKIRPFYDSELIKVIVGLRRTGKSVLLNQIADELISRGIDASHIVYFNFEDFALAYIQNAGDLHKAIQAKIQDEDKYYFLFDEIQNVEQFEKAINSFRSTMNCSIFITGSNGKLLSGELSTHLSGRYVSFKVMPFSFKEMCQIKGIPREKVRDEDFMEYLQYGGMPQRFSLESFSAVKTYLRDLYDSIVLKDIMVRGNIRDTDIINRIIEYMVLNTSQTFSAMSIAKYFESVNRKVSTETIYQYLEHITASLIINKAVRYDIRGKRLLTRSDKYYLADMGFSTIKNTGYKTEIGALIENIVFNEFLHRGYEVYVGKTPHGEIDFIVQHDNQHAYYQVAYLLADDSVITREFGAYKAVPDNFPKYVISMDKPDFSRDGIKHINIIDFLLGDDA